MKQIIFTLAAAFSWSLAAAASPQTVTDEDIYYVAATLYGEGYREGPAGMLAILETIENRSVMKGKSLKDVCLQQRQYSAWNKDAPASKMLRLLAEGQSSTNPTIDAAFKDVVAITRDALEHPDRERQLDRSALHYWAPNQMSEAPYWYDGQPTVRIGNHVFVYGVE